MREDGKLSPALWGVLTLLFLALFINYIDRGALSIAAPIIKEQFGMSPGKLGVLLSAFFWTYASFLLISGWLADRFDAGYVLAAGVFVWSVATLFTGVLPGFAGLFAMRLLLGALLMGRFGWRPYFIGLGCAGLLWLPLWLAKMPRTAVTAGATEGKEAEAGPRMTDILRQRSAWGTFLGHFGGNYLLYCLLTWLPYYLVHERHFSLERM